MSSLLFTLALTQNTYADETVQQQLPNTFSLGSMKSLSEQTAVLSTMKQLQAKQLSSPSLLISEKNSNGLTRAERLVQKQKKSLSKSLSPLNKSASVHHSFAIYDAYTQLIEDFDNDGFYQTFSVTFDADVLTDHADNHAIVYADLYLSKNGGPWIHYFTTDNFSIYGENTDDEYEVYTTLNQGYSPAEYDVLIDLYEPGFEEIVATFSSNDSNNLYALPLESSDYDPDYVVVVESTSHGHGGSSSVFGLVALMLLTLARKFK
jgi:hypothetical protein